MQLLIYFFLAIGLSMDAFSLALAYGTTNLSFNKIILSSLCVGLFHFFMPHLGSSIGTIFLEKITINTNFLVGIIFFLLALEMLLNRKEENKKLITTTGAIIFFAFTVSIDSFLVGIALGLTKSSILIASLIFSFVSSAFTFLGLILGKKLFEKYKEKALYLGIIILLFLSLKYFFQIYVN